jgi:hypothetical protein
MPEILTTPKTCEPASSGSPSQPCCASSINPKDVLICMIDEWNEGEKHAFDCYITGIRESGVDVCYLSGYRSRNDFVPWEDVVAKVDKSRPWVKLEIGFSGHFEVFLHNAKGDSIGGSRLSPPTCLTFFL